LARIIATIKKNNTLTTTREMHTHLSFVTFPMINDNGITGKLSCKNKLPNGLVDRSRIEYKSRLEYLLDEKSLQGG
jgi:hypothetical protein